MLPKIIDVIGSRPPGHTACQQVPLLVSAPFETSDATVSAMRWSFGIYTVIAAAAVWLRAPISRGIRRTGLPVWIVLTLIGWAMFILTSA